MQFLAYKPPASEPRCDPNGKQVFPDTLISTGAAADRGQSTDFIGAARHAVQALSAYAYQEASSLVPAQLRRSTFGKPNERSPFATAA